MTAIKTVLGVETSCDETGVAIYDTQRGLLAEALYSQIPIHAPFGGVVPELASRDHVRKLAPLVREVLAQAGLSTQKTDAIAYTAGPGLAGALLVGAGFARSLAVAWNVPALGVHHMEGHLLAPMLAADVETPALPFVALLVSGGHTMLVLVRRIGEYELLGQTLDDAAGEAFDKTAKLLGLPYPGGPELARLAEQGDPERFHFTRPLIRQPGLDFSFSGLKTQVVNLSRQQVDLAKEQTKADLARAFEEAVVDTLAIKCRRAMQQTEARALVIAGGVGANQRLRARLKADATKGGWQACFPPPAYCTDNGAMIAHAGALRLQAGETSPTDFTIKPRWPLDELNAIQSAES